MHSRAGQGILEQFAEHLLNRNDVVGRNAERDVRIELAQFNAAGGVLTPELSDDPDGEGGEPGDSA